MLQRSTRSAIIYMCFRLRQNGKAQNTCCCAAYKEKTAKNAVKRIIMNRENDIRTPQGETGEKIPQAPVCVYYCGHEQCAPGHRFGPATRNHHLLHFVAHGSGELKNVHGRFRVEAGSGFYIAPGETTVYGTGTDDPWEYCWIGLGGSDASRLLALAGISSAHPVFECNYDAVREITERINARQGIDNSMQLRVISDVYTLFSLLCRNNRTSVVQCGDDYVNKALAFLREVAYYDVKIDQVASYVGLDRSHLYRLTQARTGKSLKEHLIQFRLDRAKELLQSTDFGIAQIASACGFNDSNHFAKLFRSRVGVSPSQYRSSRRLGESAKIFLTAQEPAQEDG